MIYYNVTLFNNTMGGRQHTGKQKEEKEEQKEAMKTLPEL